MTGIANTPHLLASRHDHVYLLGRPSLKGFVEHVKQTTARRPIDEPALMRRWFDASGRIQELKSEDQGCVDYPELAPLPESMRAIAAAKLEEPGVKHSLRRGNHSWRLIDLDRLMVYQRTINLHHADRLRASYPSAPTDEQLIQAAIGRSVGPEDIRCMVREDNVFVFTSYSSDARFLSTQLLQPENICGVPFSGTLAAVIGTLIGFSTNICCALHFRNRLLLINASHRLYRYYADGTRCMPCLVHSISDESELDFYGEEIRQNAHLYFGDARPPMFKDYFNPALHMIVPMVPTAWMIQVQVVHQKMKVPALEFATHMDD